MRLSRLIIGVLAEHDDTHLFILFGLGDPGVYAWGGMVHLLLRFRLPEAE